MDTKCVFEGKLDSIPSWSGPPPPKADSLSRGKTSIPNKWKGVNQERNVQRKHFFNYGRLDPPLLSFGRCDNSFSGK
jgi:hypothetical protein